jgi:hypothetical protein
MTSRHLRRPFRHATKQRFPLPGQIGRVPLLSAAAIGAASMAALSLGHPGSAAPADRTNQAAVLDLPVAQGRAAENGAAAQNGAVENGAAQGAATHDAAAQNQAAPGKSAEAKAKPKASAAPKASAKPAPASKVLYYQFQLQPNGYYCGPAATRIAITALGLYPNQDNLAQQLGTTLNGTNSAADITRVLNSMTKTSAYHTTSIPSKNTTQSQTNTLQADVVRAVSGGHPVVMNIVGSGTDVNGTGHSYDGGHYLTVVGYKDHGKQVEIADPAYPVGDGTYWMTVKNLTNWAGTRGYAS